MIRTVISIDEEDKAWLDEQARREGVPMTEIVRQAVRLLRDTRTRDTPSRTDLLAATRGVWRGGDGLTWQNRLREEWNDHAT